jgi:hypothetical protein
MNEISSKGYIAIAQHDNKTADGLIRNTEVVHARWESGKLILEQWTVQQKFSLNQPMKVLEYVA